MKILLIGFKLSIGNILYIETLNRELSKQENIDVYQCGDSHAIKAAQNKICKGGNYRQMFIDFFNPVNYYKYIQLVKSIKPDVCFYISSHPFNIISIILTKIINSKIQIVSHIHDPIPHGGSKYSKIIYYSQKVQVKLSHKVVCFGSFLKSNINKHYHCKNKKIYTIIHGAYREERENTPDTTQRKYIALLGRINKYKGIETFINTAISFYSSHAKEYSQIKFIIGGAGNMKPYSTQIQKINKIYGNIIEVKNYTLSNEEFDSILRQSYALILPYNDGTQTGNIQIAYYNACPVIVSNVGSLPELIINGQTGYIVKPKDYLQICQHVRDITENHETFQQLSNNAFYYYKNNLKWSIIVKDLVKIFSE